MDCLQNRKDDFLSVSDILNELKLKKLDIGQTTIYRLLNDLEQNNLVRVEIRQNRKFYQLISKKCEDHFHLKCSKCGKLIHLDCDDVFEFNSHMKKEHKFIIDNNSIIYGRCTKCSN